MDMDRWIKRIWLAIGVLLLVLVVVGAGALVVASISTGGRTNAVVAPDTARGATIRPRAVRYSTPDKIWGVKTRLVIVRYGKGQQGAGFGSGSGLDGSGSYSYSSRRDPDGPMVNLIFLTADDAGRVLLDKPAYITWFAYPRTATDSLERWMTYRIAFEDTNGDRRLDYDDDVDLYVSDLDGGNLRRVLPAGMRLLESEPVGDGRRLFVTALETPKNWKGSDDELPQRAFLYDVPTGVVKPYAVLDSLAMKAARVLGRP